LRRRGQTLTALFDHLAIAPTPSSLSKPLITLTRNHHQALRCRRRSATAGSSSSPSESNRTSLTRVHARRIVMSSGVVVCEPSGPVGCSDLSAVHLARTNATMKTSSIQTTTALSLRRNSPLVPSCRTSRRPEQSSIHGGQLRLFATRNGFCDGVEKAVRSRLEFH
jgi:hypothetical protein